MTLIQFFAILRARRYVMLAVLVTAILGTALINALLPRSYVSIVAVMVDVKSPDPIAGIVFPAMSSPSYMTTQVDVIESDRVSRRVVQELHLDTSEPIRAKWREATKGTGDFEKWAAGYLRRDLTVRASRESNLISIEYKSADPQFATQVADAYAQAYLSVSLELRVEPAKQYRIFFDERAKQLREQVEQARAKLTAFQREKGIVGSDERLDVETARLNELSTEMVALQGASAETASRQTQARNSPDQIQEAITSPVITGLRSDLAKQESRRKELEERLGPNNPQIKELTASINEMRSRVAVELERLKGSVTVNNSINQTRMSQLQAAIDAQRVRVLQFKESRNELAVLSADVDSAVRSYDSVITRANQTELESRNTQTNLYVLNPASTPAAPSFPRTTQNMTMAVFVGTLLAVGAAMLLELFDRRVRSASELVGALEVPLLGVLKRKARGKLFGQKQFKLLNHSSSPAEYPDPSIGMQPGDSAVAIKDGQAPGTAGIAASKDEVKEVVLGQIFQEMRKLSAPQIDSVLSYQRKHGVLFGQAAVSLKLVNDNDVLWALSKQFQYPYALEGRRQFDPELIAATTPFSSLSEAFRSIRSQLIRRSSIDSERRAIAIVSADQGDGKTFVAANLAIAFSQLGQRTLLIDGDMRTPRLHRVFGLTNSVGLSSILSGRGSDRILNPVTDLPSLFVLPVGIPPPNPLELLESTAFTQLIGKCLASFDHVIVDTPSAISGADAGVIAARSGAFVSVARQNKTRMDSMIELVQSLRDNPTLPLGVILNEH